MREQDLRALKKELQRIQAMEWVPNRRHGNAGGVGNTLEDLLGVAENNYNLPDFGEWELKTHRSGSNSLLTLFHMEPSPRHARIVPSLLLPCYGWSHQEAGIRYPINEKSFRQTISVPRRSDRGFKVNIDYQREYVYIDFKYDQISNVHFDWKRSVADRAGTGPLRATPYWTFDDISRNLQTKLNNLMYVSAERRFVHGIEEFKYNHIEAYIDPSIDRFLDLLEDGIIYVDFDARTGHNHGTKFRIVNSNKDDLYAHCIQV